MPPKLARFVSEDWRDASEVGVDAMTVEIRGRRRWRDAQRAWCERHGVDWREFRRGEAARRRGEVRP